MAKRITLFLLTNLLVIITISIVMQIFGLESYLTQNGLNYQSLLVFCTLWGMGGAFISLLLSKFMAKTFMKVKIIPSSQKGTLGNLVQTVHSLSRQAGLEKMPEVGVYESPEVNAFATGPSRSNSLVAVSSGLLNNLGENELKGVLGHEVAHIANGDMVTMTLIQGVVNAFVMFFARIAAYVISRALSRDSEGEGFSFLTYFLLTFVFQAIFMILGSILIAYFSRIREYKADTGGANYAGKDNMIGALSALNKTINMSEVEKNHSSVKTMKISSKPGTFMSLLSTHPPLEDRINRLKRSR